ncbi:MAG: hypothetical protein V4693_19135 [Pseudomonadota bacterium]
MATPQYNFTVNLDDLAFILKQIKIAEASTNPLTGAAENLAQLVGSPLLPYGLRTVDGTWNSLLPGQERMGAADNVMPRLVAGTFYPAEGRPAGFFGPGDPGSAGSHYNQTAPGNIVYDAQPRIISNLIVDQTASNPAAVIAADERAATSEYPGQDTVQTSTNGTMFIPNLSPDIGLSPPFNGMMALFGQFFDHGLDLITKGGGTVFVPLQPDDPLYVPGSPTNCMVLSRAVNNPAGPDGILGNADDDPHGLGGPDAASRLLQKSAGPRQPPGGGGAGRRRDHRPQVHVARRGRVSGQSFFQRAGRSRRGVAEGRRRTEAVGRHAGVGVPGGIAADAAGVPDGADHRRRAQGGAPAVL